MHIHNDSSVNLRVPRKRQVEKSNKTKKDFVKQYECLYWMKCSDWSIRHRANVTVHLTVSISRVCLQFA